MKKCSVDGCGKAIKGPDIWTVPILWDEHPCLGFLPDGKDPNIPFQEHYGHDSFWDGEDLKLRMLEYINEFLSLNKGRKI